MTFQDVIHLAGELRPHSFSERLLFHWLTALDGKLAATVFLLAPEEYKQRDFTYPDALGYATLVDYPYQDMYVQYLVAQIDLALGENEQYQNDMAVFNETYGAFVRWFATKYAPANGYSRGCGPNGNPQYYLTAYGLAVQQGFRGSLQEWLESLYGKSVELRAEGNVLQFRSVSHTGEPAGEWTLLCDLSGVAGGYYIPSLTQEDSGTVKLSFTASSPDMPAVPDQTIELPAGGPDSSAGADAYYTPRVAQVDTETIRFSFLPSKEDMPEVPDVSITLPRGPAGKTPVKGEDYFTEADRNALVAQVIEELDISVIGRLDENNNIVLTGALEDGTYPVKYADSEGAQTKVGTLHVGIGVNQIPISTDVNGSIYNGVGYAVGKHIEASGTVEDVASSGASNCIFLTGFIPVANGSVVELINCYLDSNYADTWNKYGQNTYGIRTAFYNAGKELSGSVAWSNSVNNDFYSVVADADGYVSQMTITADVAYMRISPAPAGNAADAIITVKAS